MLQRRSARGEWQEVQINNLQQSIREKKENKGEEKGRGREVNGSIPSESAINPRVAVGIRELLMDNDLSSTRAHPSVLFYNH